MTDKTYLTSDYSVLTSSIVEHASTETSKMTTIILTLLSVLGFLALCAILGYLYTAAKLIDEEEHD